MREIDCEKIEGIYDVGKMGFRYFVFITLKGEIFIVVQMVIDERLRANMIL